jgi:hypothetical protein
MRKVREICDENPPGKHAEVERIIHRESNRRSGCNPNSPHAIFVERHADGGVHAELFEGPDFGE